MLIQTNFFGADKTPSLTGGIVPETYPVGSIAYLREPFSADRGPTVPPREVTMFRRTSNGRWTSYPGNDVSFATFAELRANATVERVEEPAERLPEPPAIKTGEYRSADADVEAVADAADSLPDNAIAGQKAGTPDNALVAFAKARPLVTVAVAIGASFLAWRAFKKR